MVVPNLALVSPQSQVSLFNIISDKSYKFKNIHASIQFIVAGTAPYWVVDTDYKNYSIVWSCTGFGFMSFRESYVLFI